MIWFVVRGEVQPAGEIKYKGPMWVFINCTLKAFFCCYIDVYAICIFGGRVHNLDLPFNNSENWNNTLTCDSFSWIGSINNHGKL